jgi:hypothetical protein
MKIGEITDHIRDGTTDFVLIGGLDDLVSKVIDKTIEEVPLPSAWLGQITEDVTPNEQDSGVIQQLSETLAVMAVLDNTGDYTGITAFDYVFTLRKQLWKILLGWNPDSEIFEYPFEYAGGRVWASDDARLFYQFNFLIKSRITDEADGYVPSITTPLEKIYAWDDLVQDGGFDAVGNWILGDGWSITGGKAVCDGSQTAPSDLDKDIVPNTGKTYTVKYKISGYSAGTLTPKLGGQVGTTRNTNGDFQEDIICGSADASIRFTASADFIGELDDAKVLSGFGVDIDEDGRAEAEISVDLPQS